MILRRFLEAPDWRGWLFLALLAAAAIVVPILNVFVPPSSPFHVTTTAVALWGKYLCYALLALSLDLVWGYCGILSLGHGAFFALGGYAMGMYLMRQIGTRGGYAHPILPDFMMFLNWKELPWYWQGFNHFPFAALMILLVPAMLAFVFGWFAFRSRVTGVYLSIITQALTFALMLGFFRNDFGFGGNNGLTDFYDLLGFSVRAPETRAVLFALSAVALALGYLIAQAVVRSKAGKVLIAIRDEESRTRFLGYRVENYKTCVFTLSACMAGVAGALYVPQVGIINPSEFAPANSIEVVIWVAVGGRGTLVGAALGAVIVNYLKTIFTIGMLAPYWLFVLGAIFVLVTIFLPRGVLGLLSGRSQTPQQAFGVPSPLAGEGQGGGDRRTSEFGNPPTPRIMSGAGSNPSPQGGGESDWRKRGEESVEQARRKSAAQPAE
jgi:urea transport system permease protein